ncbi:MAG: hypothetical protein AAGC83_01375 [Pseudomonadota bacterium]
MISWLMLASSEAEFGCVEVVVDVVDVLEELIVGKSELELVEEISVMALDLKGPR